MMNKKINFEKELFGHAHLDHWEKISSAAVSRSNGCLRFDDSPVMFDFEYELFRSAIVSLLERGYNLERVLDVGCGMGVFLRALLDTASPEYIGCDVNAHAIELLVSEQCVQLNSGRVSFLISPWQKIGFEGKSFDLIMYDTWPPEGEEDSDFLKFVSCCVKGLLSEGGTLMTVMIGDKLNPYRMDLLSCFFQETFVVSMVVPRDVYGWHHSSRMLNVIASTHKKKT